MIKKKNLPDKGGNIPTIKKKILLWLGFDIREKKPYEEMTEAERWVDDELNEQRMLRYLHAPNCFGLHYSEKTLLSYPAEEVYAMWQKDMAELSDLLDEYENSYRLREKIVDIEEYRKKKKKNKKKRLNERLKERRKKQK